jgi:hypothetical protein
MYWKGIGVVVLGGSFLMFGSGCSVYVAYNKPAPLDRDVLSVGASRTDVVGVLGNPIEKETGQDGALTETYKYADGGQKNSAVSKTLRILLYTGGDLFTICLAEVIWLPMELAFRPTDYTAEVEYEHSGAHKWIVRHFRETEVGTRKVVRQACVDPDSKRFSRVTRLSKMNSTPP